MDDLVGPSLKTSASDILVREFRQILMWPVQLTQVHGRTQVSAHWERLLAVDCSWQEVADEFDDARHDFQERHYAEFLAFMPDVQRFLYGEGKPQYGVSAYGASPIRVFRRRDVAKARVTLRADARPVDLEVERVELYFFYDIDLAILIIEVVGRDLTLGQTEDALCRFGRAYPASWDSDGRGENCCASIIFLDQDGHILAKSDYEDKERYLAFVREHREPCIAAHWAFLLQPLALHHGGPAGAILFRQLEHQRIPLFAYLAVDDPYRIPREDWVRLGLASSSGPAGSSPFAPAFLEDFEARHCYDRFWDPAQSHDQTVTRIMCSGYAFTMVGEAGRQDFADAGTGVLAQFRHQYFLIGLIAHFHRAALLIFRDRLVTAISRLQDYSIETMKAFKRDIRQTHENFLRFTHRYWFQDVSNQATAQDLFNLWVRHLGTDRLFAEVRQEVLDMIDYLDSDGLRRQANTVVRLTVVTFFGLIGTVVTGFLGMNLIDLTEVSLPEKALTFLGLLVPVTALTFYTAAKSQRLAEFLEAVADERRSTRHKLRALAQIWTRHG